MPGYPRTTTFARWMDGQTVWITTIREKFEFAATNETVNKNDRQLATKIADANVIC